MMKARVDDREALDLMARLQGKIGSLRGPLSEAGAIVHRSVMKNFELGGRYAEARSWRGGTRRWEPLKESTLTNRNSRFRPATKTKPGGFRLLPERRQKLGILLVTARLRNSIRWEANDTQVTVGTNVRYARILNEGGRTRPHAIVARHKQALAWPGGGPVKSVKHPGSKIPARPFLVIQDEDMLAIKRMFQAYLEG